MKLGFIGIGNMGSAILKGGLASSYLKAEDVYAYDVDQEKLAKLEQETSIHYCHSTTELFESIDMVLLAIKPYQIEAFVKENYEHLRNKALVSIALGFDYLRYEAILPITTRHLFIMPNTPCLVMEGMSLLEEKHSLRNDEYEYIKGLFDHIGKTEVIPSHLMGIAGSISGCGPALAYMMIEALGDAGVKYGLPRSTAYALASQTVAGSGKMQNTTELHPGVLKDMVCSPAGSTIRAVEALEEKNFRFALINAISKTLE